MGVLHKSISSVTSSYMTSAYWTTLTVCLYTARRGSAAAAQFHISLFIPIRRFFNNAVHKPWLEPATTELILVLRHPWRSLPGDWLGLSTLRVLKCANSWLLARMSRNQTSLVRYTPPGMVTLLALLFVFVWLQNSWHSRNMRLR